MILFTTITVGIHYKGQHNVSVLIFKKCVNSRVNDNISIHNSFTVPTTNDSKRAVVSPMIFSSK